MSDCDEGDREGDNAYSGKESATFGTVTHWNRNTCWAKVQTDDGRLFNVHSTTCRLGNEWPRVGQRVEVVFNNAGELLSVELP